MNLNFINIINFNQSERDKWVREQLSKIKKGEKILDAGAGECKYKKYCFHLKYISQDLGEYKGKGDKKGLQTGTWDTSSIDIISEITRIPVKNNSFDNILCTEVLEHTPYPDQVIKEFSRIINKGGKLILTAPFCSQTHFSPYHYCTGFNIYWYKKVLADNNFKITSSKRNGNFFDFYFQETLRFPLMIKNYSKLWLIGLIIALPIAIPFAIVSKLISTFDNGSSQQMCLGYHVIARKL